MKISVKDHVYVWMDLEMTGLDYENDVILEIASVVTDSSLEVLGEGPNYAIHQPKHVLDQMDVWCRKTHKASGLTKSVLESKINITQAESETLEFLNEFTVSGQSPLCGNSICTDRRFLAKYMPDIDLFLHYRHIDVSTLKVLTSDWYPDLSDEYESSVNHGHRALDDIYDSIAELKFYRKNCFLP